MKLRHRIAAVSTVLILFGCSVAWLCVTSADSVVTSGLQTTPIPLQYFGMHFHRLASTTPWPQNAQIGSWRLLDAYVDWSYLEPSRGQWDFRKLDFYVNLAEQHQVDLMLPLVRTPQWASSRPDEKSYDDPGNAAVPTNMTDWQNYVRTVATRYKGRIHEYEIWNEPNLQGFYTGSVSQMVEMARIAYTTLKEVDPTVVVCSPSATNENGVAWLDQYLQAGGGQYADVIGYHVYVNPDPPEEMVPLIQKVEAVMQKDGVAGKPLWDTETGWAMQNSDGSVKPIHSTGFNSVVLPPPQAAAYLARAYVLNWAAGVSRLYWYSWDNKIMGLTESDGKTLKAPASAYATLENWLVGAKVTSCASDDSGTWTCGLTRDNGYRAWILWNPGQTLTFHFPSDWQVQSVSELLGGPQTLPKDGNLQIGSMPVLVAHGVQ